MALNVDAIRMRLEDGENPTTMVEVIEIRPGGLTLADGTRLWSRPEERRWRRGDGRWVTEYATRWLVEPAGVAGAGETPVA